MIIRTSRGDLTKEALMSGIVELKVSEDKENFVLFFYSGRRFHVLAGKNGKVDIFWSIGKLSEARKALKEARKAVDIAKAPEIPVKDSKVSAQKSPPGVDCLQSDGKTRRKVILESMAQLIGKLAELEE